MNIYGNLNRTTALVFILAAGAGLAAQEAGSLAGNITDTAGRPVPDVRVTVTSPSMLGVRTVTTNARGEWRVPVIPVGNYSISISKQGWLGQRAENVRVGLGAAVVQNFSMRPVSEASETVEVIGNTGEIDKTDTSAKSNFSAQQLNELPVTNRRFQGAADFSPGLVSGSGGSFSIRGGQTANTQYRINGTDVKDDYQGNQLNYQVVDDNIEDIQVVLSELNARFGRSLGGSINVITKSGSNEFSGSIRASLGRDTWTATHPYDSWQTGYYDEYEMYPDSLSRQYQITLNGPIIKDRLWFAFSSILFPADSSTLSIGLQTFGADADGVVQAVNGLTSNFTSSDPNDAVNSILNVGPAGYTWSRLDSGKTYQQQNVSKFYQFKLTGMLFQDHTLEFGYQIESREINPRDHYSGGPIRRLAALGRQYSESTQLSFNYRGILTNNLFLEARYNELNSDIEWPKGDTSVMTGNETLLMWSGMTGTTGAQGSAYGFGNGSAVTNQIRGNKSGNVNLKWIADFGGTNHEFDFGVDYYSGLFAPTNQTGDGNFQINVGGVYQATDGSQNYMFPVINFMGMGQYGQSASGNSGPAPMLWQWYGKDGQMESPHTAFYLNNKFTINNHWNGMIGLRYENSVAKDTDGSELANTNFFSPRFQLKYDLKGDNAHVFGFTAARYGTEFNIAFLDAFATTANSRLVKFGWGGNQYDPYDSRDPQAGVRFLSLAELYSRLSDFNRPFYFENTSLTYNIDAGLKTPYMDEFTLSYRRQFRNGNVSLTYVNRAWKDSWAFVTEYTDPYVIDVPDPSGSGLAPMHATNINVTNSNNLKRDYQAIETEFTTRLNAYWSIGGNWTVSRLTGNHEDGDQSGSTFRDNSTTAYYLNWSILEARGVSRDDVSPYGPITNDEPQRGRLWATLALPLGQGQMSFSWSLRYDSTRPGSISYYSPIAGPANISLPNLMGQYGTVPGRPPVYVKYHDQLRGWRRSNDYYRVDFKASFAVPLGFPGFAKRLQMIGDVSVTNLFNTILNSGLYVGLNSSSYQNTGSNTFMPSNLGFWGTTEARLGNYFRGNRYIDFSFGLKF